MMAATTWTPRNVKRANAWIRENVDPHAAVRKNVHAHPIAVNRRGFQVTANRTHTTYEAVVIVNGEVVRHLGTEHSLRNLMRRVMKHYYF